MAKSSLLLLCCTLLACSVWAQKTAPLDLVIPLKLEFPKAFFGWKANSSPYFAKKVGEEDSKSILYNDAKKKKAVDLRLPEFKNKKVDFQFKAGPREPLFRRQ